MDSFGLPAVMPCYEIARSSTNPSYGAGSRLRRHRTANDGAREEHRPFPVRAACRLLHPRGGVRLELQSAGVPVTAFGVHSFVSQCVLRGARAMGQYLREHRIQLVHTFDAPANVFGVITARAFRVPVVISSQRALRGLVPWKMRMLLRATDRLADAVVANCGAVHDQLVSEEKVPAKKIHLCYNGLDTDKFRPAPPWRPPELSGASVVIGCACVMRPEKDLET